MTYIQSFPPVANSVAHILILGSMPGKESLRAGQYYAHHRNAFWPIMGELIGAAPALPYETRLQMLMSAGIALWDVLASCRRESSLDADIDAASICPNDFEGFFAAHPGITQVFFNGAMAENCFRRFVLPTFKPGLIHFHRLPSTSPAHAAMSFEQKLRAWAIIKDKIALYATTSS